MDIITKANKVFLENFPPNACFERAIFFSWYCKIKDCKYCYMSTQNTSKNAKRSVASLLAELYLCKKLGWDVGFISGGYNAYTTTDFKNLLGKMHDINKDRFWINIGALRRKELEEFLPHTKGVVGAIETLNPELHKKICPSKPIEPMVDMFDNAKSLNLKTGMTIILGLGETLDDFPLLKNFIKKNNISKIHFYSLNPQKNTIFQNIPPPPSLYHAEWIARTRIEFPKIDIQAGIWLDKVSAVGLLLKAGANSISKFPAIKYFNSKEAKQIELEARSANRNFKGTLTNLPKFDEDIEDSIKLKLNQYLKTMSKPI